MDTSGNMSAGTYPTSRVKAPTYQIFNTYDSGTYTTPTNPSPLYLKIRMVGSGGSGAGDVTGNGNNGNTTSFGTSLLTAGGGQGGYANGALGAAGTVSVSSPAISILTLRSPGLPALSVAPYLGGAGGSTPLGNSDSVHGSGNGAGTAGVMGTATNGGGGGGAGGYIEAQINSPSATYAYAVGSGAEGQAGNTGSSAYSNDGAIIVEEHYQ